MQRPFDLPLLRFNYFSSTVLQAFQRWKDGMTGLPLVDANMRELKQTGVPLRVG